MSKSSGLGSKRPGGASGRSSGRELLEAALREAESYFSRYGASLTLRGLFYVLVSKGLIPNTVSSYKRLSSLLAGARYRGEFPWHLLRDATRRVVFKERETRYPTKPLSPEDFLRLAELYVEEYSDVSVNPWEDQPFRVVVVVEKEALGDLVCRFIDEVWEHGVYQVRVIRGYDSATDVYQLSEDVASLPEGQRPVVLQLGDFDPSGEDIVRDFRERLMMLSRRDVVFEKVAVTLDQVVGMGLPCRPESVEEVEKMRRDPRYKSYVARLLELAGTSLFQFSLHEILALRPKHRGPLPRELSILSS